MNQTENVLSLFNGYGGCALALDELGIKPKNLYSSEIDKYANQAAQALYPDTVQLGDITKWREWDIDLGKMDRITAGSPCQGFSGAGKQGGTKAILYGVELLVSTRGQYLYAKEKGAEFLSQSYLFWEFILLLDHVKSLNPDVKFMLENVRMSRENTKLITDAIGVEPILINSALVSTHNRVRNYWTNIPGEIYLDRIEQPEDRGLNLIDILDLDSETCVVGARVVGRRLNSEGKREDYNKDLPIIQRAEYRTDKKANCMTTVSKDSCLGFKVREKSKCVRVVGRNSPFGSKQEWDSPFQRVTKSGKVKPGISKAACLTGGGNSGGNHSDMDIIHSEFFTRRYSVRECARLQGIPEHKIDILLSCGVSNSQLYKMLGNGWQLDTVVHVLKGLIWI